MAILGRTLEAATKSFADHLNSLLHHTLTEQPLSMVKTKNSSGVPQMQLSFRNGVQTSTARLRSRLCGDLDLYIGQRCESYQAEGRKHRLFTAEYRYTLAPAGQQEPLFRWEYSRKWPYQLIEEEAGQAPREREKWCRHHLQGTPLVRLGEHEMCLDHIHLPTGYVAIEDIIRFCLVDLGVPGLCDEDEWHDILNESYRTFTTDFVVDDA